MGCMRGGLDVCSRISAAKTAQRKLLLRKCRSHLFAARHLEVAFQAKSTEAKSAAYE